MAHLISQGVPAHRLLLLTFTRRAADEMLQRVGDVLRQQDVRRNVWGGTFHGVGARLLRIYGAELGLDPRFTIHDRNDSESLMGSICQELELNKRRQEVPQEGHLHGGPQLCGQRRSDAGGHAGRPIPALQPYADPLRRLFAAYAERKAALNVLDYDDLLRALVPAAGRPNARASGSAAGSTACWSTSTRTPTACKARLLKGLCPDGRGLTVVGDDAQSIYSFRAATIRNILDFPQDFPGTQVVTLEQNYRSTEPILTASNRVIAEARERFTKDLWSQRPPGPPPQLIACADEHEQVDFVVGRILDHRRRGVPLAQQAVLFRSAHHSILLEAELARHDLPFVKYGGLKFVEAAHVKDLLSLLRLAENPRDPVAGQRVLTLLPGIGPKKAEQLQRLIAAEGRFDPWTGAKPPASRRRRLAAVGQPAAAPGRTRSPTGDLPRADPQCPGVLPAAAGGPLRQRAAAAEGPGRTGATGQPVRGPLDAAGRTGARSAGRCGSVAARRGRAGPAGAEHVALGQGLGVEGGLRAARHRRQDPARAEPVARGAGGGRAADVLRRPDPRRRLALRLLSAPRVGRLRQQFGLGQRLPARRRSPANCCRRNSTRAADGRHTANRRRASWRREQPPFFFELLGVRKLRSCGILPSVACSTYTTCHSKPLAECIVLNTRRSPPDSPGSSAWSGGSSANSASSAGAVLEPQGQLLQFLQSFSRWGRLS